MKRTLRLVALAATLLSGCATERTLALRTSASATVLANEVSAGWANFVDRKIAECRSKLGGTDYDTPQERRRCMGVAAEGDQLEAVLAALVTTQHAIWLAAHCDLATRRSAPVEMPEEALLRCTDEEPSWHALVTSLQLALQRLMPYYQSVKSR